MPHAPHNRIGFKTRVLVPVAAIIVVLFAATLWIINQRLTAQVRKQTVGSLDVIASVFENFQDLRGFDLLLRARNIQSDPRFKAVAQVGDSKTMSVLLTDLIDELNLQVAACYDASGNLIAAAGLTSVATNPVAVAHVRETLEGAMPQDFVVSGNHLIEIGEVPVQVEAGNTGVLLIGEEIGEKAASDFRALTGCEEALFAGDRLIVSTILNETDRARIADAMKSDVITVPELVLQGRRYLMRRGNLGPGGRAQCRYALMASMEPALEELHDTQIIVILAGALGLLVSVGIVRFVLTRAAAPLDQLRAGAERIGRGDFSAQVNLHSNDEFGELARAFNEMTGNLRTSREKLEATVATLTETRARLLQSEKLSAIGEFISGVAHELNNPLTVMIGFAQLLQRSDLPAARKDEIRQIADAAERCHRIVQNLLSFARQQPPERKLVDINATIENTARFLDYELRTSNVTIERAYSAQLPAVLGDTHQLQQVILNLINNARQAIEETRKAGNIRLLTNCVGQTVRIVIEDNGPGIPANIIQKIFDPFFTTKPAGKGTGLGLSVSYGIIKEHGGEIRVDSTPGNGTAFVIDLPAAAVCNEPPVEARKPHDTLAGCRGKRILIIDDEAMLLSLVKRLLDDCGCHFDACASGEAALAAIAASSYDVVISDWKMPGMNGRDLFERILRIHPALATSYIIMSGDVLNQELIEFVREHNLIQLPKPFMPPEFRKAVAEALERASRRE